MNREKWNSIYFDKNLFKGVIMNKKTHLKVLGEVKNSNSIKEIKYWAADPAETRYSYSGGLPYHNQEQAFTKNINVGISKVEKSKFSFEIQMPNSYYIDLNSTLIKPLLHMNVCGDKEYETIELSNGIPYRFLTHPANIDYKSTLVKPFKPSGELFYNNINNLPLRTQEQILRDSAYPKKNIMPENFWGLKPSL